MKDSWSTKIGMVLAVAGSAVGLGNFLRFPSKALLNGGGAFLIPYFLAFIFLCIPLMIIEMALGRYGGKCGYSSLPGILLCVTKRPYMKYVGVLGIVIPLLLLSYYTYIESWCFSYAWYSLSGTLYKNTTSQSFGTFLSNYQDPDSDTFFTTYMAFILVFFTNFLIMWNGIKNGVEKLCLICMPLLGILSIFLFIRVFTLDTANPIFEGRTLVDALNFVWTPNVNALTNPNIWLEAVTQVFFSTSIGVGAVATYASYLKRKDDITLTSVTSCSLNEFFEIIFGASLVIPITFLFLGGSGATDVAKTGIFNIGFVTMPMIFNKMNYGELFSFIWFLLLGISAITSAMSLMKPYIAFLEEDLHWKKRNAILTVMFILFIFSNVFIWFIKKGTIDEVDFLAGNVGIVISTMIMVISFSWLANFKISMLEILRGSLLKVPRLFFINIKYIVTICLGVLLFITCILGVTNREFNEENIVCIWLVRVMILCLLAVSCFLARKIKLSDNNDKNAILKDK